MEHDESSDEEEEDSKDKDTELNDAESLEIQEQLTNMAMAEEEDYEFHHIKGHRWEN